VFYRLPCQLVWLQHLVRAGVGGDSGYAGGQHCACADSAHLWCLPHANLSSPVPSCLWLAGAKFLVPPVLPLQAAGALPRYCRLVLRQTRGMFYRPGALCFLAGSCVLAVPPWRFALQTADCALFSPALTGRPFTTGILRMVAVTLHSVDVLVNGQMDLRRA